MGRSPCCDKIGLKKGPWTSDEDRKLLNYIQQHGHGNWHALPSKAGLRRCGKSCRLRWANYLRPDIKRGKFSIHEDDTIIQLHALLGNRWSTIAAHLPKRTDNEIKNYWNTHLKKRLTKMGIDPVTHKPCNKNQTLAASSSSSLSSSCSNISHMAQWESARLEAEARSKLIIDSSSFNPNLHITKTVPLSPCLDVLKAWAWANPGKDISAPALFCENPSVVGIAADNNNYHHLQEEEDDLVRGIMGNSTGFSDTHNNILINLPNVHCTDQYSAYCPSLGFQSFNVGGFTDASDGPNSDNNAMINVVRSCWGVLEADDHSQML